MRTFIEVHKMKKTLSVLWTIFIVCIVVFIISVFVVGSDAGIWRVFSIVMPVAGVAFWGAIILRVLDYIRTKKNNSK